MTQNEVCNKCLSSKSMEGCLLRKCPFYIFDLRRTEKEIDEIVKRENIKLKEE